MYGVLIGFVICLLGVIFTGLLFAIAMRHSEDEPEESPGPAVPDGEFFLSGLPDGPPLTPPAAARRGTKTLLSQLERHVRVEQAAASEFLQGPSPETLHAPSKSPFWN